MENSLLHRTIMNDLFTFAIYRGDMKHRHLDLSKFNNLKAHQDLIIKRANANLQNVFTDLVGAIKKNVRSDFILKHLLFEHKPISQVYNQANSVLYALYSRFNLKLYQHKHIYLYKTKDLQLSNFNYLINLKNRQTTFRPLSFVMQLGKSLNLQLHKKLLQIVPPIKETHINWHELNDKYPQYVMVYVDKKHHKIELKNVNMELITDLLNFMKLNYKCYSKQYLKRIINGFKFMTLYNHDTFWYPYKYNKVNPNKRFQNSKKFFEQLKKENNHVPSYAD